MIPLPLAPGRSAIRRVVVALIAFLFLLDLGIDLHYTHKYGGIDLRDKVMGGRMLFTHRSIYTYKWQPGDPEQWLDPNDDPAAELNRYTGTPAQSLLFATIAWLPFGTLKYLWTALHYLLFAATLMLLSRNVPPDERLLLWSGAVLLMLSTVHWHLHVERAQTYILFGFAMAGVLCFAAREGRRPLLWIGVLLALLAAMKPTYAVLGLPFLLARRWPVVISGLATGAILVCLFLVLGLMDDWQAYFQAMSKWTTASFDTGGPPDGSLPAGQPAVVEGLANLRERKSFEVEDSSLQGIAAAMLGRVLSPLHCQVIMLLGIGVLMVLFARKAARMSTTDLFLLGFVAWTWAIICLPAPRFGYQYVQWLAPLVVLVRDRSRYPPGGLLLIACGALFALRIFAFAVPYSYLLGEGLMLLGLVQVLWARPGPAPRPVGS